MSEKVTKQEPIQATKNYGKYDIDRLIDKYKIVFKDNELSFLLEKIRHTVGQNGTLKLHDNVEFNEELNYMINNSNEYILTVEYVSRERLKTVHTDVFLYENVIESIKIYNQYLASCKSVEQNLDGAVSEYVTQTGSKIDADKFSRLITLKPVRNQIYSGDSVERWVKVDNSIAMLKDNPLGIKILPETPETEVEATK